MVAKSGGLRARGPGRADRAGLSSLTPGLLTIIAGPARLMSVEAAARDSARTAPASRPMGTPSSTRIRPSTMVIATSVPRAVDQRGPRIGARREVRRVGPTRARSARLPGAIEPISASRPSAWAPPAWPSAARPARSANRGRAVRPELSPRGASRRTCRGGCCRRRRRRPATRRCPGPAAPRSAPAPNPSLRFEPGQWSTWTPRSAMIACSPASTHTQWAAHSRGEASPSCAR